MYIRIRNIPKFSLVREIRKMNKLIFLAAIIPVLLVPNVYAGGPRGDGPENASPEADRCYIHGYDSGFAGKYDADRAENCEEHDDWYNKSWNNGCNDAGYIPKECDDFRNNPVQVNGWTIADENTIWCWSSGYWDGRGRPAFDKDKASGCSEYGSLYDNGFMEGCIRADNNQNRTSCDRLTKD